MKILGIETSCDETAAAVLDGDRILSNAIFSQVDIHREYGGVVPELASRHHLQKIDSVVDQALGSAGITLDEIEGIAVTSGPGLVGCLLVGLSYAKAIAWSRKLPLVGVNHLEGHIRSAFLESEVELPALFLVVSGGHTALYHVTGERSIRRLAHTRDDAAGEAYDKVAKLLGLGYPGGPVIDRLATGRPAKATFRVPKMSDGSLDFSFSGVKTAVLYRVRENHIDPWDGPEEDVPEEILDLVAEFQESVVAILLDRTFRALPPGTRSIGVVGGVACNRRLRQRMAEECGERGLPLHFPRPILCADNAAMIAAAGGLRLAAGESDPVTLNADPGWQIYMKPEQIRNFSIIAHIDHGKSTLADRILQRTGAVKDRDMKEQVLDDMELERERGITIKARAVSVNYRSRDGEDFLLNFIDTPGHVDFSYEVSRALSACEGALLIVDATQGVEAQTLANTYLALDNELEILPVINKIDLPSARPEDVKREIEEVIGLDASHAVHASAKEGIGIDDILEEIVHMVPPPQGNMDGPLKALIFDSWYDPYRGVVVLFRVVDGTIRRGQRIKLMATGKTYDLDTLGIFTPAEKRVDSLSVGEVGFLMAQIKNVHDVAIGDTVTEAKGGAVEPLPGFQEVKPMVFAGLYPTDSAGYEGLRDAMEKLALNDASFRYEPESSEALGFGFRCGFLGLLHMEIVQARLEREFDLGLITTAPSVNYKVQTSDGEWMDIASPSRLPAPQFIEQIQEPYITALILTPPDYLGTVLALTEEKRGIQKELKYITPQRAMLTYELPLTEVVSDFYDKLKAGTRGYASLDYHLSGYKASDMVKMDLLVNGEPVDALSLIVHRDKAFQRGKTLATKMHEVIPRQMFEVIIQAALGNRVIARETIRAMRKNVLAKCYGGDISRKRKLLEKQKEGKRRMKRVGSVDIPQEAFMAVLKL